MRKGFFISGAVLFSSVNFLPAQITFQKTFGSYICPITCVEQTTDGGYMACGFFSGNTDYILIKSDANGDTLWTKTYAEPLHFNFTYSALQTTDGGYILIGTSDPVNNDPPHLVLLRMDSVGDLVWSKKYSNSNMQERTGGNTVKQTADGGFIAFGTTAQFGGKLYLIRTNASGDTLWSRAYDGAFNDILGNRFIQTIDGGFIFTGNHVVAGSDDDVLLVKLDSLGNVMWSETYGGADTDDGGCVQQTQDGGYIIAGVTESFGAGDKDIYLLKTDANGTLLWSRTFGGAAEERTNYICETDDAGFLVTGITYSFGAGNLDGLLIKTDFLGNIEWSSTFGGPGVDNLFCGKIAADGGYILGGETDIGPGLGVACLIKTDSIGNSGCNQANIVVSASDPPTQTNNIIISIYYPNTAAFNYSLTTQTMSPIGSLCSNVGVNELLPHNTVFTFPNPAPGDFVVSFGKTIINGNIEITDLIGKRHFIADISENSNIAIHLNNISRGYYLIKLFDGERYYCRKLIVDHN